jgi:hypothetical protein
MEGSIALEDRSSLVSLSKPNLRRCLRIRLRSIKELRCLSQRG